jgi:putative SOS response-associated peptidase YedK
MTTSWLCAENHPKQRPFRYAIVEGMTMRDSRVHNYPPRWNAAPSQELLVIRRNHQTWRGVVGPLALGLIPLWCKDPAGGRKPINAKFEKPANDDPSIVEPIELATDP